MHLNGKGIKGSTVMEASPDIKIEDVILLRVNDTFNGYGVAKSDNLKDPAINTIKIRKIGSGQVKPNEKLSTIDDAVSANKGSLVAMEKNAINAINGVASQGRNRELPVTVSFSGGKDSLVVLNLTRKAVKQFEAFFVDTGLEFPETTKFVEDYAAKNHIRSI